MTPAFVQACQKGTACCNEHRLTVEFLEKLAEAEPRWKPQVEELRSKLDHLQQVSETGLLLAETYKR